MGFRSDLGFLVSRCSPRSVTRGRPGTGIAYTYYDNRVTRTAAPPERPKKKIFHTFFVVVGWCGNRSEEEYIPSHRGKRPVNSIHIHLTSLVLSTSLYIITIEIHSSCEIEHFVETHCKL